MRIPIIPTLIGVGGIAVTSLTVPEVRCTVGLQQCTVQNILADILVDIIVKGENSQPLQGVKVSFASKGAPEVVETDSNGYAQIKIPRREDININLLKDDYQPQNFTVNLDNSRENTRIYTLKKLDDTGDSTSPSEGSQDEPDNPKGKKSIKTVENNGFKIAFEGCYRKGKVNCKFSIVNLESENRTFFFDSQSRTFDSSGNEYNALQVWVSNNIIQNSGFGSFSAQSSLIQGVSAKAGVNFDLPTELDSLAVLEVNFNNRIFQFRDVKINR